MPDFRHRATQSEYMDDLQASGADLHRALAELDAINRLLGGNRVTLDGIDVILSEVPQKDRISVADLGCGSGDMLRRIRRRLSHAGVAATLTGIDANPNVIVYARARTSKESDITFEALDIFSTEFKTRKFDIVTASLFFHHFTSSQLIAFFRQLKDQTSLGFVINDIHRHRIAHHSIRWLTHLFSRSRMVKNDAPLSVLRAFRKDELANILTQAGIVDFTIRWCWAFRWQVIVFCGRKAPAPDLLHP